MLTEIRNARQVEGEGFRRWFMDEYFDLIVWYDDEKSLIGFQLCYDKQRRERALTWTRDHGFQHNRIDAGETPGHSKMTPIIVADGAFSRDNVADRFREASGGIEPGLARFVHETLLQHTPRRSSSPQAASALGCLNPSSGACMPPHIRRQAPPFAPSLWRSCGWTHCNPFCLFPSGWNAGGGLKCGGRWTW